MFGLTEGFTDYIEIDGKEVKINLAFDNVLRAYEILKREDYFQRDNVYSAADGLSFLSSTAMTPATKIYEALKCFGVKGSYTIAERAFLLEKALGRASEYSRNVDNYNYKEKNAEPLIDYKKDAGLIYCAFLQGYGVDLFEMQGKLHWAKFLTLLNNIPDEARLAKVIGYRGMKLPALNSHNRQEIMHLRELKDIYRLNKTPVQIKDRMNNALASLFL